MDTGIYVALSKEVGILRDMEVISNNIANMNSTGYQGDELMFSAFLSPTTPDENNVAFANTAATYRDMEQGTLQQTGNALDVAIEGSGFFAVQTPLGQRYTRNGNFKVNNNGVLVTSEGYTVLDQSNQPFTFDELDRVINIHEDGTINVDGTDRGVMQIVKFDNPQLMRHVGNALFTSDVPPKPADSFRLVSGALERSNVNPFNEVTRMIQTSRDIANFVKYISSMYTLEGKAEDTLSKEYT